MGWAGTTAMKMFEGKDPADRQIMLLDSLIPWEELSVKRAELGSAKLALGSDRRQIKIMQKTLYKYMPIHNSEYIGRIGAILSGRVYFSSPAYFNDPFEMSALLAPMGRSAFEGKLARSGFFAASPSQKRAVHRRYLEAFNAKTSPALSADWIDALGVLCLTTEKNNLLMWAHYAANHSGVCIGFDSEHVPDRKSVV